MSHVQPDLFGEDEAAQAARAIWSAPATCPICGHAEPTGWALHLSHGVKPGGDTVHGHPPGEHPIYRDMCQREYHLTGRVPA